MSSAKFNMRSPMPFSVFQMVFRFRRCISLARFTICCTSLANARCIRETTTCILYLVCYTRTHVRTNRINISYHTNILRTASRTLVFHNNISYESSIISIPIIHCCNSSSTIASSFDEK